MKPIHPNLWTAVGIAAFLAAFFIGQFIDSPSDWEAEKASAASLHDAITQAQQSGKWTDEQKRRAKVAAEMVAQGVQP